MNADRTVLAVRAYVRSRRQDHPRPRSWSDRYAAVFGLAMAAVLLAHPLSLALGAVARQADPARIVPGLILVVLALGAFLAAARALGPVAVSAADAAWLVLSPLPRRAVLSRSAGILLAVALAAGVAIGFGLLAVLGPESGLAAAVLTSAVLGMSASAGGMALSVLAQADPGWDRAWPAAVLTLVVLVVLAAVFVPVPGSAAAVVAAALLARRAWAALTRLPAASVLAASTRAGHLAAGTAGLDPSTLTWIAEDNHWRSRVLRSRPWPALLTTARRGFRTSLAPAWYDWRRFARRPLRAVALAASAALPALAAPDQGGLTAVLLFGGAMTAAVAGTAGMRRDASDPSLSRLLGLAPRPTRAARSLLPALLSCAWLALALVFLGLPGLLPFAPLAAPAIAAGALRMAARRPIDHSMPAFETPGGAIPLGPMIWALTGIDIAVIGSLPFLTALTGPSALAATLAAQAVTGAGVLAAWVWWAAR
ncbi:hypothetical protein DP939_26970 [Spongiactinospora rosea]|uniref:ABC-2 type transport system permease protein n=1 Tax=Spongiactinospora rosea TaxID=2248750 RepID=A0A366LU69_9ACTN|nr:DUF6297 family protein [Spongiactinospora rosea]RBQ17120.1 hypothetical protein DP939_26970 [Spongiactinospora rosea]